MLLQRKKAKVTVQKTISQALEQPEPRIIATHRIVYKEESFLLSDGSEVFYNVPVFVDIDTEEARAVEYPIFRERTNLDDTDLVALQGQAADSQNGNKRDRIRNFALN